MFVSQASAPSSILLLLLLLPSIVTGQPLIVDLMNRCNTRLERDGSNVLIESATFFVSDDASVEQAGKLSFFSDRGNKLLPTRWDPNDPIRNQLQNPSVLTFAIDQFDFTKDVTKQAQVDAMRKPFATWAGQECAKGLDLREVSVAKKGDIGLAQAILLGRKGGGSFSYRPADIMVSGFLPGGFFDLLAPNGSRRIIGVNFAFRWTEYTDKKAYADIYFNDAFTWRTTDGDGDGGGDGDGYDIDIETVALHEVGHGFDLEHTGAAFVTEANQKLHFAPRAVMNAGYSGEQRELTGSDRAGFCNEFGHWPNV